jgi:hypothetical protein
MKLYHATTPDAAKAILAVGFRDSTGSYMCVGITLTGVFVSNLPVVGVNDGAKGSEVLEITAPDDADLADYAIVEEDMPVWEFCIPAKILNRWPVRLLSDDDLDLLIIPHVP